MTTASGGSGRSVVHFSDGTTYEADIVIGADGIKSAVRAAVVGDNSSRVAFTNTRAYRALIPLEALQAAGVSSDIFPRGRLFVGNNKVRGSALGSTHILTLYRRF